MFKRRNLMQVLAALALPPATGIGLLSAAHAAPNAMPPLGTVLAVPTVTLLDGTVWQPAGAAGKTLVVYWWASWCPFCAVQSPYIEALWRAQKANGLQVLGLSIDKTAPAAVNYMKTKGYTFAAGMMTPEVVQQLPKPPGLPVVVVLKVSADGKNGKVVFAEAGEMLPEDVEGLKKYL